MKGFNYKHGQSRNKSSTYRSWLMMKNRCLNSNATDFKYYGGRGIKVCRAWHDFENFRKDMGDKPTALHTIGRLDSNKGYSSKNCKWETRKEQSRARKYCKLSVDKVKEMKTARAYGMSVKNICKKFKIGKTTFYYAVSGRTWA